MSLKRVCKMELEFPAQIIPLWGCYLDTMTRISDLSPSEMGRLPQRNHMTIESVDPETKSMKQRFTKPEFFEGYKMITASTRVIPKVGSCIVESIVEYEKSGPEIEDLEVVDFIRSNIDDIASRTGEWEAAGNAARKAAKKAARKAV